MRRLSAMAALIVLSCAPGRGANERDPADGSGELLSLALEDRGEFADRLTAGARSDYEKALAVTTWFAESLDWTSTDYEVRTVDQILERGGGNCGDLAAVTTAVLEELGLEMRHVREVNLQAPSDQRQKDAEKVVAERGLSGSVFGRLHNDHAWLEIRDRDSGEWFPADPSLGVVGKEAWVAARLGFGERFSLDPTSQEMIAPFAVFAFDEDWQPTENRSAHYLVEGFDALYDGKLSRLPAWVDWTRLVETLDEPALGAFRGEVNLHAFAAQIEELASTYESLREQYESGGG